jgi:homocysteine S-methyltransferase
MRLSITLAADSRGRFATGTDVPIDSIKIALSLAAYGASLPLPHEFDGYYPPPYGPKAYVYPPDLTNPNRNTFHVDETSQEAESEDLLTAFHLERLRAYASDKETWRAVDAIAFETIPLAREVKAIRRAVAALEDELAPEERKPWWVCTIYPGGEIPEEHPGGGGGRLGAKDVLAAYFDEVPTATTVETHKGKGARYAVPDAFGINCTATAHVASAVAAASDALAEMSVARSGVGGSEQPWLVLKPNGGQTYDMDTRKWGWYGGETRLQGDEWAKQLGDIVHSAVTKGVWGGILVGGCCKAGEEELCLLSKALQPELQ